MLSRSYTAVSLLKMTVPKAFLIVVDDVISLYSPVFPYVCTGIEELLLTCIHRLC